MGLAQKITAGDPLLITGKALAEMLGITTQTVGAWVQRGKLPPAYKTVGTTRLWHKWIVRGWLEGVDAETPAPQRAPEEPALAPLPPACGDGMHETGALPRAPDAEGQQTLPGFSSAAPRVGEETGPAQRAPELRGEAGVAVQEGEFPAPAPRGG